MNWMAFYNSYRLHSQLRLTQSMQYEQEGYEGLSKKGPPNQAG